MQFGSHDIVEKRNIGTFGVYVHYLIICAGDGLRKYAIDMSTKRADELIEHFEQLSLDGCQCLRSFGQTRNERT